MNKEDKELLLKDLSARLLYGVYVLVHDTFEYSTVPFEKVYLKSPDISSLIDSISLNERYNSNDKRFNRIIKERKDFLEFKPYLFPLSSMTEEQALELYKLFGIKLQDSIGWDYIKINEVTGITFFLRKGFDVETHLYKLIDWLLKNHFDFRGLIPKGLALDATGLNIY